METEHQKIRVKVRVLKGSILEYKLSHSDALEYEVSSSDTIQSLQTKIKESQGIDEKDQHLGVYNGHPKHPIDPSFLPNWTFEKALIKNGDTIDLHIRKKGYRLYFKTLDGQVQELDADVYDSVGIIKELIQGKTGHPVEKQRIIFGGKQLEDHRIAAPGYGIQKDSTLHLIIRSS